MRSCAYCGKDLAADEVCDCMGAVRARGAKGSSQAGSSTNDSGTYNGWQESTYQTGYTKKKKKRLRDRFKFKKPSGFNKNDFKGAASEVSGFTKRFIHDPVNTVSNPGHLNMAQILIIMVLTALVMSVCGFFAYTRIIAGLLTSLTASLGSLAEVGMELPKYHIMQLLQTALYGTVSIVLLGFVYLLVLYLINRFLLRRSGGFTEFIMRPVAAMIPLMVFGLLGFLINFFSVYAMVMLFLTGLIMWIVLTYEALRAEWSSLPAVRIMYMMALSFFIFFVVLFNIIRLF